MKTKIKVEKVKKTPKVSSGQYHLIIKLNEEVFETDTDDIAEAIFALNPKRIVTKAVITITKGDQTVDRFLLAMKARMLFKNKLTAQLFAKSVSLAFN